MKLLTPTTKVKMKKKFLPKGVTNARIEMRTRTSTIKQTQKGMTTRTKGVVTMASMRTSTAKARVTTTATRNLIKKGGGGKRREMTRKREKGEAEAGQGGRCERKAKGKLTATRLLL